MAFDPLNLADRVFELTDVISKGSEDFGFKYVVLKMKNFSNSEKTLLQIIDMSDKILYNKVKAEKSFLALINAAVSHELRNPLSSLIGQIEQIQDYFESFKLILNDITDP